MDIITAIRYVAKNHGVSKLFNNTATEYIVALNANLRNEAKNIALALQSGDMKHIKAVFDDVCTFEDYQPKSVTEKTVAEYYFRAFGFPGYRQTDESKVGTLTKIDAKAEFVYEGEIENGKENGIGKRTMYYGGKLCQTDESVWLDGAMYGYCKTFEIEFEVVEKTELSFVENDTIKGTITTTYDDGYIEKQKYHKLRERK